VALKADDVELIKSFQSGDTEAFTQVVGQYREPLFRHAMRRLNNVAAAEDAVQETFLRAYRAFDRLRDDSRLGPWLHQILNNVCIDEGNRRTRDRDKSARFSSDPLGTAAATPGLEEQIGLDQDSTPVLIALESLPSNYRDALTMRFVDELSYNEMAEASGISEQNVRARVSRARTAVRAAMRTVAAVPVLAIALIRRG
jgi:RNA polymerase sigma-70 factor (ECF subfamily)